MLPGESCGQALPPPHSGPPRAAPAPRAAATGRSEDCSVCVSRASTRSRGHEDEHREGTERAPDGRAVIPDSWAVLKDALTVELD